MTHMIEAMEIIHKLMNILLLPLTPIVLLIVLPPYLFFKIVHRAKRYLFSEKVAGKVILITGAASGIGEQIAYEYARRGARLALADKREDRLVQAAEKARGLGSSDVTSICADISLEEDCKRVVEATVNHFGTHHLVNNAGIIKYNMFENITSISDFTSVMNVNFWGQVYCTHFAIPYLKRSKGKIIAMASATGWYPIPKLNIYGASKAAVINFYETLRIEMGEEIGGITIVTPSIVNTELLLKDNIKTELRFIPKLSREECAKEIVKSACRGDKYLVVPSWVNALLPPKMLFPDLNEYLTRWLLVSRNFKDKFVKLK